MKTVLVALVRNPWTVLITENRHLVSNPTSRLEFDTSDANRRFHGHSLLTLSKKPSRVNGWDSLSASLPEISNHFEAISGINIDAKLSRQIS